MNSHPLQMSFPRHETNGMHFAATVTDESKRKLIYMLTPFDGEHSTFQAIVEI